VKDSGETVDGYEELSGPESDCIQSDSVMSGVLCITLY